MTSEQESRKSPVVMTSTDGTTEELSTKEAFGPRSGRADNKGAQTPRHFF